MTLQTLEASSLNSSPTLQYVLGLLLLYSQNASLESRASYGNWPVWVGVSLAQEEAPLNGADTLNINGWPVKQRLAKNAQPNTHIQQNKKHNTYKNTHTSLQRRGNTHPSSA